MTHDFLNIWNTHSFFSVCCAWALSGAAFLWLFACLLCMGADGAACGCLLASPRVPRAPCWPFWFLLASPRGASGHPFVRFECVRASLRGASGILLGMFVPSRMACDFKCRLRIPFFNASDGTKKGQLGLRELMGSFP